MAKPLNERYFASEVLHQISIKRLENSNAKKIGAFLSKVERDIFVRHSNNVLLGQSVNPQTRKQFNRLLGRVDKDLRAAHRETFKRIRRQMTQGALFESQYQRASLRAASPFSLSLTTPAEATLLASVFSEPFQGRLFKDYASQFSTAKRQQVNSALRTSFYQGEGQAGAANRLLGRGGVRGVLQTNRRGAEAVARTGLNHAVNQAKLVFYRQNQFAKKFRYTATIDGRTSLICSSRDGNQYLPNERPFLPAHINCRSTYVAIADGDTILGERQTITSTQTKKRIQRGFTTSARRKAGKMWRSLSPNERRVRINRERKTWQRENIGTVPAKTTYNQFLKGQSAEFQNDYLGKNRAQLFRRGGLNLNQFTNMQTGLPITLKQLRQQQPNAFKLAGL